MDKKAASLIVATLLLASLFFCATSVSIVRASTTITIKSSGEVVGTTFITSADNITYVFTGDIQDSNLFVQRSNIIIDGQGHLLNGTNSGVGVDLSGMTNVTLKNLTINRFQIGVHLFESSSIGISGNTITNCTSDGVYMETGSSWNNVTGNTLSNDYDGVYLRDSANYNLVDGNNVTGSGLEAIVLGGCTGDNVTRNNVVNGLNGVRFDACSYGQLADNNFTYCANGIVLGNAHYINVSNNMAAHNWDGILSSDGSTFNNLTKNTVTANSYDGISLYKFSSNNTILKNTIASNLNNGIFVNSSEYNVIEDNNVTNNNNGIYLNYSAYHNVSGNYAAGDSIGIEVYGSSVNIISGNNVTNNGNGIRLDFAWNNIVSSNVATHCSSYGIYVWDSVYTTVSGNTASDNSGDGIVLDDGSPNNNIIGNNATNNSNTGIRLTWYAQYNVISGNNAANNGNCGIWLDQSFHNVLSENNVTANADKGIYLYLATYNNLVGNNVTGNNDGIWLTDSSDNNTLDSNNVAANTEYGINVEASLNNSLCGNTVAGGAIGVYVSGSSNCTSITGNGVTGSVIGILLDQTSDNNTVDGNTATANFFGIGVAGSFNTVVANNVTGNQYGVVLATGSDNNTLLLNTIAWNTQYGIYVTSSYNLMYHNCFINNTIQAHVDVGGVGNAWNGPYPVGGNYWTDYVGTDYMWGPDEGMIGRGDGFGDSPYIIDANNWDYYPLMQQWTLPDIAVSNFWSSKTVVCQSFTTYVTVEFTNLGSTFQYFNLAIYLNTTLLWHYSYVPGWPNYSWNATLSFATSGLGLGNYTMEACALPVADETNILNNNCTGGWVRMSIIGDLTGGTDNSLDFVPDGLVDMQDVGVAAMFYLKSTPPAPSNCDLTGTTTGVPDNFIDMNDIGIIAQHYLEHE